MGQCIPIQIQPTVYDSEILVRICLHKLPINPDVSSYVLFSDMGPYTLAYTWPGAVPYPHPN